MTPFFFSAFVEGRSILTEFQVANGLLEKKNGLENGSVFKVDFEKDNHVD